MVVEVSQVLAWTNDPVYMSTPCGHPFDLDPEAIRKGKAMQTATMDPARTAETAPSAALPDTDALLSELGALYPVMTFAGGLGDAPPADAWEAPSGSSQGQGPEERRYEMDERIMAGLLRA